MTSRRIPSNGSCFLNMKTKKRPVVRLQELSTPWTGLQSIKSSPSILVTEPSFQISQPRVKVELLIFHVQASVSVF